MLKEWWSEYFGNCQSKDTDQEKDQFIIYTETVDVKTQ